ncbi:MAG: hypothetical protein HC802_08980, partial [Caldilineaceae bacterium]|nr:hypothetical protein [Caldilineaceae bacterium]
ETPALASDQVVVVEPAPEEAPAADAVSTDAGSDDVEASAETDEAAAEAEEEAGSADSAVPDGLALLSVENTFEGDIRFTLDQKFRVVEGPSEMDLLPGDVLDILVYPGVLRFSVSSNWRAENVSGNAEFTVEPDELRSIWIKFVPDPDGSGWDMLYQWP